jgi:2-keto-4-pentenoate hydratase
MLINFLHPPFLHLADPMALTKADIRLAAERLHQAEKARKQIRQLSLEYPAITIEDAGSVSCHFA